MVSFFFFFCLASTVVFSNAAVHWVLMLLHYPTRLCGLFLSLACACWCVHDLAAFRSFFKKMKMWKHSYVEHFSATDPVPAILDIILSSTEVRFLLVCACLRLHSSDFPNPTDVGGLRCCMQMNILLLSAHLLLQCCQIGGARNHIHLLVFLGQLSPFSFDLASFSCAHGVVLWDTFLWGSDLARDLRDHPQGDIAVSRLRYELTDQAWRDVSELESAHLHQRTFQALRCSCCVPLLPPSDFPAVVVSNLRHSFSFFVPIVLRYLCHVCAC